jgi:protein gp37
MSDKTGIEWTDASWNPLRGCSKVSEGCRNCYAETLAKRFSGPGMPYEGTISDGRWSGQIRLVPEVLEQPLKWKRPRKIFVNSMSDLFHPNVPFDFIDQVFAVMALASQHTFQILTKRPERMNEYFQHRFRALRVEIAAHKYSMPDEGELVFDWPLPNVWIGTSVENQKAADERIPLLLQTPAAIRFLSCEPLLGPVDLKRVDNPTEDGKIVWVIVGGESGHKARPMHPDWARSLRDQCQTADVAYFHKQNGEWLHRELVEDTRNDDSKSLKYFPEMDATFARVGKHKAGRQLDGREWNEFPETTT